MEQAAKQLDVLAAVARRFVHVVSDQAQLKVARRATDLAGRTEAIVRERVAVCSRAGHRAEPRCGRLGPGPYRGGACGTRAAEFTPRSGRTVGGNPAGFARAVGELSDLPEVRGFQDLVRRLEADPDLARFATGRRQAQARLRLAEAQRRPDIRVGAGIQHQEALDAQAKCLALHALLFQIYQELLHARTEEGFRVGRFSLLDLSIAQSECWPAQRDMLWASRDYTTA